MGGEAERRTGSSGPLALPWSYLFRNLVNNGKISSERTAMPDISVVMALYNKAPYVTRAIDSILGQTVAPQEIIIVDDGSTDGGGDLVSRYQDPRITLVRQENRGVSAARNRGVQEAKGELLAFLDADDAWKPRFLEVILQLQEQFPQAGAFATAYEIITPEGHRLVPRFEALPPGQREGLIPNYIRASMASFHTRQVWPPVWASAVAIPKRVLLEVGGFPEGEKLAADLDTWLNIALRYPIAWSAELAATYHQDAENRTAGVKMVDQEPKLCRTVRRVIEEAPESVDNLEELWEYGAYFQVQAAGYCLWQGKRQKARQLLEASRGTTLSAKLWRHYYRLALLPPGVVRTYWQARQLLKRSPFLVQAVRRVKQWCGLYR